MLSNNALTQHEPCSKRHRWGQGDDSSDMQYPQLCYRRNAVLLPRGACSSPCWGESCPAHKPEATGRMLCCLLPPIPQRAAVAHLPSAVLRPSPTGRAKHQVPLQSFPFPCCLPIPLLLPSKTANPHVLFTDITYHLNINLVSRHKLSWQPRACGLFAVGLALMMSCWPSQCSPWSAVPPRQAASSLIFVFGPRCLWFEVITWC